MAEEHKAHPQLVFLVHDPGIFMSYWYGALFVVIEGWRELQLSDPSIEPLLASDNVDLLKRYRTDFSTSRNVTSTNGSTALLRLKIPFRGCENSTLPSGLTF